MEEAKVLTSKHKLLHKTHLHLNAPLKRKLIVLIIFAFESEE